VKRETAIVILNWNRANLTIKLLKNIRSVGENCDVIVTDNNSSVEEREKLQNYFNLEDYPLYSQTQINDIVERRDCLLVLLDDNYGYAKGNNFGLRIASRLKYRYVLISNNDIEIVSPVIEDLKNLLEANPDVAVVGPKVSDPDRSNGPYSKLGMRRLFWKPAFYPFHWIFFHTGKMFRLKSSQSKDIEAEQLSFPYYVSGSFMLARLSSLEEVDYFDENTFLYGEERILAEKLLAKGYRMAYLPGKEVKHNHGASTSRLNTDLSRLEFESRLYYFSRYRGYGKIRIAMLRAADRIYDKIWYPLFQASKRKLRGDEK